jgi:hypothetical protein
MGKIGKSEDDEKNEKYLFHRAFVSGFDEKHPVLFNRGNTFRGWNP